MEKLRNKIVVILGPTSSGKSDIAIKLARKFSAKGGPAYGWNGAEIISADSRQIYRGMDIGTGKVTDEEQKLAKHWMLDIVSPKTNYSAAKFKKRAEKIILDILERNKMPIICGGTGFWIKSIVDNISYPKVKPDPKLRRILSKKSAEELFKMLQKIDPERAKNIDAKNKIRLVRAIEICKAIGKVPAVKYEATSTRYDFLQIGIKLSKEKLHENIKKRLKKRFQEGMIEEVKKLKKQGLSWKKIQSFGLGYFWIPLYLQEKISKEELFEKVYLAEKDYAKRQMTWFKRDKRIIWISDFKEAYNATKLFLR